MTQHYLIQDDDGILTVFRAKLEKAEKPHGHDHWQLFGTVPPEEMPPALAVGMKVLAELEKHPGRELDTIDQAVASRGHHIAVYTVTSKPVPLVGIDWLKSLPELTVIQCSTDPMHDHAIVTHHGIHRLGVGQFMRWDDTSWRNDGWVLAACQETCPEWTP